MKTARIPNENRQNTGIYFVASASPNSPEQSRTVQYNLDKVRRKVRRSFRIEVDKMTVTVHRGDNLDAIRVIESATPPKYFIDDEEVDQATFDRELEREA